MSILPKTTLLKKELSLLSVYAIGTGTTLSAGFFLLPGLAFAEAGPAMILAYFIAAIPLIPAMLSKIELGTAMPRAGGIYYILDRSMGPLIGTIGGLGIWLVLVFKIAFALIGMGAYLGLFIPGLPIVYVAITLAIVLGGLNLFGAKKSGTLQVFLVVVLLSLLTGFIGNGLTSLNFSHFDGFFDAGFNSIISTAGLVYISYIGVTKVVSLSEDIKDPERNLPLGVFLSMATAFLIYALGTIVMVGVIPAEKLSGDLTPVATAAQSLFGNIGTILISIAALLAFVSVANAGMLSASRYPLAMSRDHVLSGIFQKMNKWGTPTASILVTVGTIIVILLFLNPTKIAKLASSFQLLIFSLVCIATIIMRESRIPSYDPGYLSPLYPWMQIVGIVFPFWLIMEMGWLPILFTLGVIGFGTFWYFYYARNRVVRSGAIYHLFARLGKQRFEGLDVELRGIMKEKGLRKEDPFDEVVARAFVLDMEKDWSYESMVKQVATLLSQRLHMEAEELEKQFLEGNRMGHTPVVHGVALPHLHIPNIESPEMVVVRSKPDSYVLTTEYHANKSLLEHLTFAFFFLVSPDEDPAQHLRILAQIAGHVENEGFMEEWLNAKNEQELKEILLRDERFLSISIEKNTVTEIFINRTMHDVQMPEGCLIALIRRNDEILVPRGHTILEEGDRITIIGDIKGIWQLRQKYGPS